MTKNSKQKQQTPKRITAKASFPPLPPAGLQIHEAARYVGLSELSLRKLVKRGILSPCRVTSRLVFPRVQLDNILNGEVPPRGRVRELSVPPRAGGIRVK
jgi:hypothetical protein